MKSVMGQLFGTLPASSNLNNLCLCRRMKTFYLKEIREIKVVQKFSLTKKLSLFVQWKREMELGYISLMVIDLSFVEG